MVKKIVCKECKQLKDYYANDMCRKCYNKKWAKRNPDKCKLNFKKWRKRNPDKCRLNTKKQRDKRKSQGICRNCCNPINYDRSISHCSICLNKKQIYKLKQQDSLSIKQLLRLYKYRLLNLFWAIYYFISKKRLY